MKIAGIDGCHFGWVVASRINESIPKIQLFKDFQSILNSFADFDVIVVDMPIGLVKKDYTPNNILQNNPKNGRRDADIIAKRILSEFGRDGSVFYTPELEVVDYLIANNVDLGYGNYENVSNVFQEIVSHKISKQTFGIIKKIIEINSIVTNNVTNIYEFHPEITWIKTCGMKKLDSKKSKDGKRQRLESLTDKLPKIRRDTLENLIYRSSYKKSKDVSKDDIIDALSGLLVAEKIFNGLKNNDKIDAIPELTPEERFSLPLQQHIFF